MSTEHREWENETYIERAHDRFKLDVYDAVLVGFFNLHLLYRAELDAVSEKALECWTCTHLATKDLAHVLPNTAIVALRILVPIDTVDAPPSNNNTRLLTKLARSFFLGSHASTYIPDLRRLDFGAIVVQSTRSLRYLAHLDFEMGDDTVVVLAETLTLDIAHFRHHSFCFANLRSLCRAFLKGWFVGIAHGYVRALEADGWG
jgi:hypothetical protein